MNSVPVKQRQKTGCLSFAQERMWFLAQLEPANPVYNSTLAIRITGSFEKTILEYAFNQILSRHETLRTRFTSVDGKPIQVISDPTYMKLLVVDARDLGSDKKNREVERLVKESSKPPFDLENGPLLRTKLLRIHDEEHIFIVVVHHISFDAWSTKLFIKELQTYYSAAAEKKPVPLPDLSMQYADFSKWQRQQIKGGKLAEHVAYWKEQLKDSPSALNLPTSSTLKTNSYQGATLSFVLPESLTLALKDLSQSQGMTLFTVLLSAFYILLHRYSGQDDIAIGSPVAGRTKLETEELIGIFINTLVLRVDLSRNPTFLRLLNKVRETLLGALTHQDLPFEKLVVELSPERNLHSTPFFQVMFNFKNIPNTTPAQHGPDFEELLIDNGVALFDLNLEAVNLNGQLTFLLKYKTDLFEHESIRGMIRHYQTLLKGIVHNYEARISQLPLLSKKERHQQLVDWNPSIQDDNNANCVHKLFEKQVEQNPDAVAIIYEENTITYREANEHANCLAHYLHELGISAGSRIGLCIDRSPEVIVAILGIWKAGGTYIPLDPEYPQERLSFMLADAQVQILLTKSSFLEQIPELEGEVVAIDRDWPEIESHKSTNPTNGIMMDSVAYVIYTSGSTGTPKGVMISHFAFANYCQVMKDHWQIISDDRVLQLASLSFDVSLAEIFIELVSGASTVLPTGDFIVPRRLTEIISEQKVTRVNFAPALWRQWVQSLVAHDEQPDLSKLRIVVVGSDIVPSDVVHIWNQLHISNVVSLVNAYGPTESTVTTTTYWFEDNQVPNIIPIGRSLPGTPHYILDSNCELLPAGVSGELHIGGNRLAIGYLNHPELTAEKFIPDPFSDKKGSRLYKTGDLARYLPDGNIEFLGRIDHQVKVRGFRVELGEIEFALSQHPSVKEVVVTAIENKTEEKRLVAYIVCEEGEAPSRNKFRQFLKAKLPEFMIPQYLEMLESFPVNPNGKIDRNALRLPDQSRAPSNILFVAPRNEVEKKLAGIWGDVLKLNEVGIYDNFFELGGHSLNATQVISRIYDAFRINLPIASIFDTQTLAEMAELVAQKTGL